jgi:signal transduction histidine kinase
MKDWLRSKIGGLAAFLLVVVLVTGGLGWVTMQALRLEAEAQRAGHLRVALWRLDSRVSPLLAREDSRPFDHYSAIYATPLAFQNDGSCYTSGTVLEPSPLLHADLPEWMLLHFQTTCDNGWESPQVPSERLLQRLQGARIQLKNVTAERRGLLQGLQGHLKTKRVLTLAGERGSDSRVQELTLVLAGKAGNDLQNYVQSNSLPYQNPQGQQPAPLPNDAGARFGVQTRAQQEGKNASQRVTRDLVMNNVDNNGENWFGPNQRRVSQTAETFVHLGSLTPLWVPTEDGRDQLLAVRLVHVGDDKEFCQGIVLDDAALETMLAAEVQDLFPDGRVVPMREPVPSQPELAMSALPFQLDPGPISPVAKSVGWTPLRIGLAIAWGAALVALLAVGLGGWSLIDLSERRIRFVSAVTHELRTPLTTLRLYLDMLMNGMVRDEARRSEYIHTLHAEADRLNRLVGNVLDFSRLEKQRPKLNRSEKPVNDLLAQLAATWQGRCHDAGKELVIDNRLPDGTTLWTDAELLQQVLGNLLDNACKYSRDAADKRLWVRVGAVGKQVYFDLEDRGPGVSARERCSIFRAFRRGREADVTAGGVGLGLALAKRWAQLLGGRLALQAPPVEGGACFRVELPAARHLTQRETRPTVA